MSISVAFRLKRPKLDRITAIIVDVSLGQGRMRTYTGISVHPEDWDRRRQCVKMGSPNEEEINRRLTEIRARIGRFESQALLDGAKVNPSRLRTFVRDIAVLEEREPEVRDVLVLPTVDQWIEIHKHERAPSTLAIWRSLRVHLQRFDTATRGEILLRGMDNDWIERFINHLRSERNLCDNALWKVLRTWRTFSRWAEGKGYDVHPAYKDVKGGRFNIKTAHAVRLTKKQFEQLRSIDLSHESSLENARRLFLLQCCLGVRYSDLRRILADPERHITEGTIRLRTQKTDTKVTIPLLPLAHELLLGDRPPHPISNQKYNAYLKLVAEAAGFTKRVTTVRWQGRRMIEEHLRMCDLLTTHAAKRTFVTLMATAGVRTETIMKVTGNSRATIDTYVHLNDEEVELEVLRKAGRLFE